MMALTRTEKETLWDTVKDIRTCMLTTIRADDNSLRSRPMELVQDNFDGLIYLYTEKNCVKVDELFKNPDACLSFCDHKNHEHVSMSVSCILSQNQDLINKFWTPCVSAWFPLGKESATIIVCEVQKAEIWDSDTSTMKLFYEIMKANLINKKPDLGEHLKLG
jgi:general stress protein 26